MKKENNKKAKKIKDENKSAEIVRSFKRRWILSGTNTILLIAIIIAIFILINTAVKHFDFTAIDCTTSKSLSLTEESKERVGNIDKEVNIYFVGYDDADRTYTFAKQYNKANSKINVEIVDATKDVEFAKKYDVTNDSQSIIIECGKANRTLMAYDLVSYDSNYNTTDVSEQKITSAILNVTAGKIPKAYYLTGYTTYSFDGNGELAYLAQYLNDEVLEYEKLNILNTEKVPDDCDTLIIMTPQKDFDEKTADEIIKYIKKGGNILWFNGMYAEDVEFKNVNKVLKEYGIKEFEKGIVYETNINNTILGYDICFMPEIQQTDVTEDVFNGEGAVFFSSTKINVDEDKLEDKKVVKTELVKSSDTAYFTKDLTGQANKNEDKKGPFLLGAKMEKTISEAKDDKEEVKSTLIIYANEAFVTDKQIISNVTPMIYIYNNSDLALNSLAYLTNNDQDITIRKNYLDSETTFTATDGEKTVIMKIIFIVPIGIIVFGITVWIIRRRKK